MPKKKPNPAVFRPKLLPRRHAALVARVPFLFDELHLSVTLVDAYGWHSLYLVPNITFVEVEHGLEPQRFAHNQRSMREAVRRGEPVLGRHAGFYDLFVPIETADGINEVLVLGPFRQGKLTGGEIQERWRWLTGHQGHLTDPEFSNYVARSLATPVFEGPSLEALKDLVLALAGLIAEIEEPERLGAAVERAMTALEETRFKHHLWEAVHAMIDARSSRIWASLNNAPRRREIGLRRIPEHALVGLFASPTDDVDPVDEAIQRDEFRHACVRLVRARGDMATGPIGDHGVVFLLPAERSEAMTRAKLVEVGERTVALARRQFRLRMSFGVSNVQQGGTLPASFQSALGAAEKALGQGAAIVHAAEHSAHGESSLRALRSTLSELDKEPFAQLALRFDRYIDAVASRGFRVEVARPELNAGLERLVEPLLQNAALDRMSWNEIASTLDRSAEAAATLPDLFSAFRRAVSDVERALADPANSHRERSLRRAVDYIREHSAEPLKLKGVARVAGFEPHYFSRVFKQRERLTFEKYVTRVRIERAQQMLHRTSLSVDRVAKLCGFATSQYFHAVFKRMVGKTPLSTARARVRLPVVARQRSNLAR